MTQEELDALMGGEDLDIDSLDEVELGSETEVEEEIAPSDEVPDKKSSSDEKPFGYSDDTAHHWPLPATEEHKMVHQLDDVTKESEEKASEIFDIIEGISTTMMEKEESIAEIVEIINSNIELFKTLSEKFPDVEAFKTQLAKNEKALVNSEDGIEMLQTSGDEIMNVMDIMQYQDIHRQKIERVINVMRALSKYMNTLFEGQIDDEKRVSSANHIPGDDTEDLASTEDIEALLAQFGNND
ncbi:chemotaxis protein [Sulfurimonas sp.]|nr:chemotaxis protein [Sulfurimonas sp.]